ncbi:MAG: hypothetical protein WKF87_07500 [Chryseolinea sp.]
MKSYVSMRIFFFVIGAAALNLLGACEQEHFEPKMNTLPGGGTVTTYKAYTLSPTNPAGDNVYGRVVFYKYSSTVTLVQMGLYNTEPDATYSADIFGGSILEGATTVAIDLDDVSGTTGAFVSSKYFVMNDATFYETLGDYDASVKVMLGTTPVAAGDIGANADPVAVQD